MHDDSMEDRVAARLALFDDEPDVNDWFEVALGAAFVVMGLHQMFNPGGLWDAVIMQWLGAASVAMGMILTGHGLKDMAVKEVRAAMVRLDMDEAGGIDLGLIRDVLLHPGPYERLLFEEYALAFADGELTQAEHDDLMDLGRRLNLSERQCARLATRAAIATAMKDGKVTEAEGTLIIGAATRLGVSEADLDRMREAFADGVIDTGEFVMLNDILDSIPDEEE